MIDVIIDVGLSINPRLNTGGALCLSQPMTVVSYTDFIALAPSQHPSRKGASAIKSV